MKYFCNSPVLFHVWNRIDVVKKVFLKIRETKPKKLYFSSDGPNNIEDKVKIHKIRNYIKNNIDWNCKLKQIFFKKNLGPKLAITKAINKVFKTEKKLIIIDHDCLCDNSFFKFTDELLELYENEKKIKLISGNYICKNLIKFDKSYYFAKHPVIFGWATWKRSWIEYDIEMKKFKKFGSFFWLLTFFNFNIAKTLYFYNKFKLSKKGKINTWDYQLLFSIWNNNGLVIRPTVNLSKHIGWGEQAYHGKHEDDLKDIKVEKMKFPLKHPKYIEVNKEADEHEYKRIRKLFFWRSIFFYIKQYLS